MNDFELIELRGRVAMLENEMRLLREHLGLPAGATRPGLKMARHRNPSRLHLLPHGTMTKPEYTEKQKRRHDPRWKSSTKPVRKSTKVLTSCRGLVRLNKAMDNPKTDWKRVDQMCHDFGRTHAHLDCPPQHRIVKPAADLPAASFDCTQFVQRCPLGYKIELFTMAKGLGYKITASGLVKYADVDGPRFIPAKSEREFIAALNMPWTEPRMRELGSVYPNDEPADKTPITPEELAAWRDACLWIDTTNGGEAHQFTVRPGQKDDKFFARICWTIYELGYDSNYKGVPWRYLDLDGIRYFTCGYLIKECQILNRKPFKTERAPVPWKKNPLRWRRKNYHAGDRG